ncbi:hypothetical protein Tco_0912553, partial [Tanacetum coccineum]
ISKQALEFADRKTDKNLRKQMIKEAIKAKKEKQESERVQIVNPFPLGMGTWYDGEPLWDSSELGGYLVVEGLLRIAPLSHATYPERKCFPTGILV